MLIKKIQKLKKIFQNQIEIRRLIDYFFFLENGDKTLFGSITEKDEN